MPSSTSPATPSAPLLPSLRQLWLFPVSLVAADFLLAGMVIALGGAFWLERVFTAAALLKMSAVLVAGHLLSFTYWERSPVRRGRFAGRFVLGSLLAVGLYWVLRGQMVHVVSRPTFATMVAVFAPLQAGLHFFHRRPQASPALLGVEPLRWMIVAAAALVLHRPLLTTGSVGAGDAYWYTIMVADFVSQWRDGVFPVFVGQTEFAFNGAISPLRFAPGLQHLAGVVDLVTLHSLSFHGILNLTLVLCYLAGALTCYGCLRAIEPGGAWLALVLAWLYSACPGVLALAYAGDLFMSVTAVPWVPVLLYGAWRTLTVGDLKGVLIMVAGLAALWYCHPPIAFWGMVVAVVTQAARLVREGGRARTWRYWLIGAGAFGALSLYCFVSVKTTALPAYPAYRPVIIENLRNAFPGALKPVSNTLVALSDYQLGWALWGAMAAGVVGMMVLRPRRPALAFAAAIAVLLAFLLPTPWLLEKLWMGVPQAVCDITFMWPMQRFYVLLAGLSVFLAYTTLGPLASRRPWWGALLFVGFFGGAGWSGLETNKFHQHAATPAAQARQQLLPQNRILTRYAFNPIRALPPYISHGYIDPLVPNRLLTADTLAELASNGGSLENDPAVGVVRSAGELLPKRPNAGQPGFEIAPKFRLEPGRRYVLKFEFAHPEFIGALKIVGPRMSRVYWLPDSAYDTKPIAPSRAFAALPDRPHFITLWTDGTEPEEINLLFFFTAEPPADDVTSFGRYVFSEFDPALLPVRVDQWAPYRASVKTAAPAYLETPRMFFDGYRARVNDREVEVSRSPHALAMVPVPAGESRVELSFTGPWRLRAAYFLSLTAWILLLGVWLRTLLRDAHRASAA